MYLLGAGWQAEGERRGPEAVADEEVADRGGREDVGRVRADRGEIGSPLCPEAQENEVGRRGHS